MTAPARCPDTAFFGHPRSLRTIVVTEAWERFAQYGMQTLLVLYLAGTLLQPGRVEHVLGFAQLRSLLECVLGPLSITALASAIYGLYASAVFLTPVVGGLLADRFWGKTRAVILGGFLMVAGHIMMISQSLFLLALLLLTIGVGCFKGNLATQIGAVYQSDDRRRAAAFQIYSLAVNAGVIAAPLVIGTLGERMGWRYGFGAAAAGMAIGLAAYLSGRRTLPPDPPRFAKTPQILSLTTAERARVQTLLLALFPLALAAVGIQQVFNAYLIWASQSASLMVGKFVLPTTWLISIDMIMSVISLLIVMWVWNRIAGRTHLANEIVRMMVGCGFLVAAYLVLAAASFLAEENGVRVSLGPLLVYHLLASLAFAHIFPASLALFARVAPIAVNSTMMGVYFLHLFAATAVAGLIGGWLVPMGAYAFWLLHAAIPLTAVLLFTCLLLTRRRSLATA